MFGEGIRREVVEVREGSRVVWKEETQRKAKGCGLKERSEEQYVFVCPQPPVTCCVVLLEHAFV